MLKLLYNLTTKIGEKLVDMVKRTSLFDKISILNELIVIVQSKWYSLKISS